MEFGSLVFNVVMILAFSWLSRLLNMRTSEKLCFLLEPTSLETNPPFFRFTSRYLVFVRFFGGILYMGYIFLDI